MIPTHIIIHHSLSQDKAVLNWKDVRKWHVVDNKWSDIGYHYGIEKVVDQYEILVGRMLHRNGAHCTQQGMNRQSIGICFIGNFDNSHPPPEQWSLGVIFVASLCKVHSIPVKNIYGHRDFADYKSCPGRLFDMGNFKKNVAIQMGK